MKYLITGGSGFIGTNLVDRLIAAGHEVVDLSNTEPLKTANKAYWKPCDIVDREGVLAIFREAQPDIVIHLAARTDCDENTTVEKGYRTNTDGTASVLAAIAATPSIKRAVITSSQFVCGPAHPPGNDTDYGPHTVYGQSKVITEQLTRAARLPCCWTLIRPTNIWGPWHMRYSREFWRIAAKGIYFHPAGKPVVRCYGYVGTVIDQILRILELPEEQVNGRTFYVGDAPDDIYKWADAFCLALCGKHAPKVPRPLLRLAGLAGDVITKITGKNFYITSSRYRSMVSDYAVPLEETYKVLGRPTRTLEQGVAESAAWYKEYVRRG